MEPVDDIDLTGTAVEHYSIVAPIAAGGQARVYRGRDERLRRDVTTLKGWWTNRAARVLLVFVLSTLGASAGTLVAGTRMGGTLFQWLFG